MGTVVLVVDRVEVASWALTRAGPLDLELVDELARLRLRGGASAGACGCATSRPTWPSSSTSSGSARS